MSYCGGLGAIPLPTIPLTSQAGGFQTAQKYQDYTAARSPSTTGIQPNAEALLFYEAVRRSFVPDTAAGLGLLLEWLSPGTSTRIAAKLYEFQAFLTKWYQVPFLSAAMQAQSDPAWLAAIQAEYGQQAPSTPTPMAAPIPVALLWSPGLQILVDYRSPPSPGDGMNFATVGWRSIEQNASTAAWRAIGPWVGWRGAFVHRTNDQRIMVLDQKDVVYESRNYQGVPGRVAPMWDVGTLDAMIQQAGAGTAPPALAQGVITPPAQVIPTIPSGSIPPLSFPSGGTPPPAAFPPLTFPPSLLIGPGGGQPWIDIAVPPPTGGPGGTIFGPSGPSGPSPFAPVLPVAVTPQGGIVQTIAPQLYTRPDLSIGKDPTAPVPLMQAGFGGTMGLVAAAIFAGLFLVGGAARTPKSKRR